MTGNAKLKKLFEPFHIGKLELKNRIVMSALGSKFPTGGGYVTQQAKDYYEERARGGVGLLIVQSTGVQCPICKPGVEMIAIDDDRFIPGLSELAELIRKSGAKPAVQLQHAGRQTTSLITEGLQPVAPSPIPMTSADEVPRELSIEEIRDIIRCYGRAAERAKRAGFEAIEINGHGGYLVHQFLSRHSNKRQDEYGGSLQNRARFLVEVIQAVKESTDKTYPVWCRIVGRDYGIEDGLTLEEGRGIAKMAEKAGADAIHVTAYGVGVYTRMVFPDSPGALVPLAEEIKRVVSVPVIAHGRIGPELGERILRDGKADLIAMGRALVADPELPNKAALGRLDDIARCTACLHCQDRVMVRHEDLKCRVNAAVGREREYRITLVEKPKKVLIVGGGPAGMEAARVAALRGHKVSLYDNRPRLGGQALVASIIHSRMEYRDDIGTFIRYLSGQIRKLGVDVRLGKQVDPALIAEIKPDVLVLATGSAAITPEIPGITRGNVISDWEIQRTITFWLRLLPPAAIAWLSRFWLPFGRRVAIIGGGIAGCQLAGFLVQTGRKVSIAETSSKLATGMVATYRRVLLKGLSQKSTVMLTNVKYDEVTDKGLVISQDGKRQVLKADSIVSAVGSLPNITLFKVAQGQVPEIYLAGDCAEPHLILEAIHEGSRVGRAI